MRPIRIAQRSSPRVCFCGRTMPLPGLRSSTLLHFWYSVFMLHFTRAVFSSSLDYGNSTVTNFAGCLLMFVSVWV